LSSDWLTDYQWVGLLEKDKKAATEEKKLGKSSCTTPNCDGIGNTRKKFKTHTSVLYCPLAKAFVDNIIEENKKLREEIKELKAEMKNLDTQTKKQEVTNGSVVDALQKLNLN